MSSAQAWPFVPWLCIQGTVLSAGSMGGWGALLCPDSHRRMNVFSSDLSSLPLTPLICFLFLGISLPVYPLQQKMPGLLAVGSISDGDLI